MTDAAVLDDDLRLAEDATAFFLAQVGKLDETSLHEPSPLPGWTRGHVMTHVARNADGIARLAGWALTGVEEPMYGDRHPRNPDIEAGATRDLKEQVTDLRGSSRRLAAAFARLSGAAWSARVRTPHQEVDASFLPWMRAREVWLHAIDLGVGATYQDLPAGFATRLLDEVAHGLSDRPGMPALSLDVGEQVFEVPGSGSPVRVTGTPAAVACWLSGRPGQVTRGDGGPLPALPAWL